MDVKKLLPRRQNESPGINQLLHRLSWKRMLRDRKRNDGKLQDLYEFYKEKLKIFGRDDFRMYALLLEVGKREAFLSILSGKELATFHSSDGNIMTGNNMIDQNIESSFCHVDPELASRAERHFLHCIEIYETSSVEIGESVVPFEAICELGKLYERQGRSFEATSLFALATQRAAASFPYGESSQINYKWPRRSNTTLSSFIKELKGKHALTRPILQDNHKFNQFSSFRVNDAANAYHKAVKRANHFGYGISNDFLNDSYSGMRNMTDGSFFTAKQQKEKVRRERSLARKFVLAGFGLFTGFVLSKSKEMYDHTVKEREKEKCADKLMAYVKCMEAHAGVKPDPYELEWCNAERDCYRECRGIED
eukprot:g3554.t1